jgi:hypothetical protein
VEHQPGANVMITLPIFYYIFGGKMAIFLYFESKSQFFLKILFGENIFF